LPILIQIPIFFSLFKVLSNTIEMRHAPFFGWIVDLSAPDPTNIFTLCGLIPLELPGFLTLGLWPLIMGLSMLLQQRMSPPPADPTQRIMFTYGMPIIFTYMFSGFSAGVVIYWTWNNLLSMAQQWMIGRMAAQETLAQKKKKR
ncbi:MAG: membrane protein insertase YidC, partial [Holosporaceae bacterium]